MLEVPPEFSDECPTPGEPPPASELFVAGCQRTIDRAEAYAHLGLIPEAERELESIPPIHREAWMEARKQLLSSRMNAGRIDEAVAIGIHALGGLRVIDEASYRVARSLVLALHFSGRYREELVLMAEICAWVGDSGHEAHQTACCLARQRRPTEAVASLSTHLMRAEQPDPGLLIDGDLALLWPQLAAISFPLATAHLLYHPRIELLAAAPAPDLFAHKFSCTDFDDFDDGWRLVVRPRQRGLRLDPTSALKHPTAYACWHQEIQDRLATVRTRIGTVRAQALCQVVHAQTGYAIWHLGRGNHNAARNRLLFALAHDFDLLDSMRRNPGLAAIALVLDEVAWLRTHEPHFLETVVFAKYRHPSQDTDRLWLTVQRAPARLRETNLWRAAMVELLTEEDDITRAMPLWIALAEAWPEDVFGMANLARALVLRGRFEEAERALSCAPRCFTEFLLTDALQSAIRDHSTELPAPVMKIQTVSAPDLGGALKPEALPPMSSVLNSPYTLQGELPLFE